MERSDSDEPFRWSEDFAHFLRTTPGALFGLGAGDSHAALHTPDYDFSDEPDDRWTAVSPAGAPGPARYRSLASTTHFA